MYDETTKECTREMGKQHNQCLTKSDNVTYLQTYNCEYIKSPKPERFARAMVSDYSELVQYQPPLVCILNKIDR